MNIDPQQVVSDTRHWLESAVIGLNLCPFAKAVHVKGQVHYAVSPATDWNGVLADLERELHALLACSPDERDTTLLMVPACLHDFVEFTGLVAQGERVLAQRGVQGQIQLASFHPRFQFAGTAPDAIENFTNRAPYPTLHLLREASIDRAVTAFPDASAIYDANIATLERLGHDGWHALMNRTKP
ncbi:MAG: DUF1415 domain-containing protein [Pseudomonadota bacterium]